MAASTTAAPETLNHTVMFLILLFMLFLGPTQVLWAIVVAATTENPDKRRHLLLYLLGVVLYFASVYLVGSVMPDASIFRPEVNTYTIMFYFGAWALAAYHFVVVIALSERKPRPEDFELPQHA